MSLFDRVISVDIGPEGGEGKHIEGIRISFRVDKTATRTINSATVDLYNLGESTREEISGTQNKIIVNAGYAESAGSMEIFRGDVDRFQHIINPPDRISHIEAGDGEKVLRQTRIALSFSPGASATEILEEIASKLPGISAGEFTITTDKEYANGWSFVGLAADALDRVAQSLDASWSIQNNEIQIVPQLGNNQTEAILLSPESGLLGSPEYIEAIENNLDGVQRPSGWRLRCLLQPQIIPRGIVSVQSEEVNGNYTVETVLHRGDTHGYEWNSIVEVFEEQ